MSNIQPLSSFYLVTHTDLIKFGVDMTQKAKQNMGESFSSNSITSTILSSQLPQLTFATESENTIKIKKKNKKKYDEIEVDRETGLMIKSTNAFSYIFKFDQRTFPKKDSVLFEQVSYWDIFNEYIEHN